MTERDGPVRPGEALHRVTDSGGTGFYYAYMPQLFSGEQGHGPLLLAWDSNILIDLQDHGSRLINGEGTGVTEPKYAAELDALGRLLDLWLLRDIRFVLSPRASSDAKAKVDSPHVRRKREAIDSLAEALTFQVEDWGEEHLRFEDLDPTALAFALPDLDVDRLTSRFPAGADRDLINEAVRAGLHVFLTRDQRVWKARTTLAGVPLKVMKPTELMAFLDALGVAALAGGVYPHVDCPYADPLRAGDMGKWAGLLAAFETGPAHTSGTPSEGASSTTAPGCLPTRSSSGTRPRWRAMTCSRRGAVS